MLVRLLARRTVRLSRRESLAAVPVLNPDAIRLTDQDRTLLVLRPAGPRPTAGRWSRLLARLRPPRPAHRFSLDAAGVEVVDLMDGRRTVGEIISRFGSRHALPRETADYAVTTFLRTLLQRNLAVVVLPAAGHPPATTRKLARTSSGFSTRIPCVTH